MAGTSDVRSVTGDPEARQRQFQRALEGDTAAYWAIIEPYGGLIFSIAHGLLNDADRAHDVLHDVYVQAWRSLANLRSPARIASWLYTMTRNRCFDLMRREVRADKKLRDVAAAQPDVIPIYEVMINNEELRRMHEAIRTLPEPFREILSMKYTSGLKCREIAEVLDISLSAVKTRLFEARKLLATRMDELERQPGAAIQDGGQNS